MKLFKRHFGLDRYEWEQLKSDIIGGVQVIATAIAVVVLVSMCQSCKTVRPLEVEKITHDTLTVYKTKIDTTMLHDSIFQSVFVKGDTVTEYKYVLQTRYKNVYLHDSIYINKTDTLRTTEIVEVEKELSKWQRFVLLVGRVVLLVAAGAIVYGLYKAYRVFW